MNARVAAEPAAGLGGAAIAWLSQGGVTYRACELCLHGRASGEVFLCNSPAAQLGGGPERVAAARAVDGSCGPNARHLEMQAWA